MLFSRACIAGDVTLDNGMRVIVVVDRSSPLVAHGVYYNVGSYDDPMGRGGIAHLLEHMMFGATANNNKGEYGRFVARSGGYMNAFTSFDRTFYFSIIPVDDVDQVMRFEADRMRNVVYADDALSTEKDVVIGELKMREDLMSRVFDALALEHDCAYAFKRPVIGFMDEVKGITVDDLKDFYNQYYSPDNAILLIVGDVDEDDVVRKAREYFGGIDKVGDASRGKHYSLISQNAADCSIAYRGYDAKVLELRGGKQDSVSFVFNSIQYYIDTNNPSIFAAQKALSYALGGYGGGRLRDILLYREKIASSVSVGDGGPYIFLNVVPADGITLDALATRIMAILSDMAHGGLTTEELGRFIRFARSRSAYARDGLNNIMMNYVDSLGAGVAWTDIEVTIMSHGNLDEGRDAVNALIKEHIIPDSQHWVYAKAIAGAEGGRAP